MGQFRRDRKGRACWMAQVADHDGKIRTRSFDLKADMLEYEFIQRRRRQRIRAGLEIPFEPRKLSDWLWSKDGWIERRKMGKKASWVGEIPKLEKFWLPRVGTKLMHEITISDLQSGFQELKAQGLAPATINRHRSLLHTIWNDAAKEDPPVVTLNPLAQIPLLSEKVKVQPHGHFEEADMRKYLITSESFGFQWFVLASIQLLAAARIDEAVVLKWKDVSWENATILVERIWEIASKTIQKRTKGNRGEGGEEFLIVLPELMKVLLVWKEKTRHARPNDFIVCDAIGRHYTYWQAKRIHDLIVKQAGLPEVTPHGLRHTAGRYLRRLGFQGDDLKGLMRHKDSKTTEVYSPVDMKYLVERARRQGLEGDNERGGERG